MLYTLTIIQHHAVLKSKLLLGALRKIFQKITRKIAGKITSNAMTTAERSWWKVMTASSPVNEYNAQSKYTASMSQTLSTVCNTSHHQLADPCTWWNTFNMTYLCYKTDLSGQIIIPGITSLWHDDWKSASEVISSLMPQFGTSTMVWRITVTNKLLPE